MHMSNDLKHDVVVKSKLYQPPLSKDHLHRDHLLVPPRLFLGWFGPRGLVSIVFAVIVIESDLPGSRYIAMVVVCTVFMSLVLHGLSAQPLSKWIGGNGSAT